MSKDPRPVTDADLHAYVDGELDEQRRLLVEAHLAKHPGAAEQVRGYRQLNQDLHSLFDPVLNESVPAALVPAVRAAPARYRWSRRLQAAALAGVALLSGLTGWLLHDRQDRTEASATLVNLVQPAAFAHLVYATDTQYPVEIQAEQQDALNRWLSDRMHTRIRAPGLDELGFELVGGRLLPSTNRMAAQFMYQNAAGERITLYVRRVATAEQHSAFHYREAEGVGVFYWIDGPMGYALSGDLGKQRLVAVAQAVQRSFAGGV
ncbi:MAG TPA: anti-sigma factor [Gammaproteobacteria bacterium]|nr:anti-sigma factor [Gammaproteobacteria bacterium]